MIDPSRGSACRRMDRIQGGSAQAGRAQERISVCLSAQAEFMTCLKVSGVSYSVEVLPSAPPAPTAPRVTEFEQVALTS